MLIYRILPAAAIAFGAIISDIEPLHAQRAPSGIQVSTTALLPSERLGSGTLTGGGAALSIGLSPRVSLLAGADWYRNGATEDDRAYDLFFPSISLRATLIGEQTDLALLGGVGMMRFKFDQDLFGGPSESEVVPAVGLGAALRVHLAGPLSLEFSGRDWISLSRERAFTAVPGDRGIAHTPEIRVAISALFKRKEPSVAAFADLPISYANDFRPIDAATVARPATLLTKGRDHVHVDQGKAVDLRVVETAELNGEEAPHSLSLVAPRTEATTWEEHKLGTIYFQFGSFQVGESYRTLLNDVARYLAQNPDAYLELRGFTDSVGSADMNLSLAERRGTAIKELLVRLYGVSPERISVTAFGIDYKAKTPTIARRVDLTAKMPAN